MGLEGGMAHWLRAPVAPSEDPGSAPNTHNLLIMRSPGTRALSLSLPPEFWDYSLLAPCLDPITCFNEGIYLFLFIKSLSQSFSLHFKSSHGRLQACVRVPWYSWLSKAPATTAWSQMLFPGPKTEEALLPRQNVSTACYPLVLMTGTGTSSHGPFSSK